MSRLDQFTNDELLLELTSRLNEREQNVELKKLEEEVRLLSAQIRESENDKSAFLSNVRNEINNPLTSILGLAESITRLSREEKIKSLGSLIHRQAFELDFQIRNIILASEIETGDINPLISQVDISSLLESQLDYLSLKINAARVAITLELDDTLLFPTDSYLLQAICMNLLANAIEFSGKTKLVKVRASLVANCLVLNVTDFGEGIAADKQSHLFKRFKQLDSGSTKVHAGQGLGLAIVHELVSILNGTIELDSSAQTGTSITIHLPMPEISQSNAISSYGNEVIFNDAIEF